MKTEKKENSVFEIEFLEGIVKRCPDFVEALTALGDLYTSVGRHADGLEIDKRLTRLRPQDAVVLYNLACSYSLLNDIDKAFWAIKRAIHFGYDDLEYLQQDDDLRNVFEDSRFKQYFAIIWKNALKNNTIRPRPKKMFKDQ